VTSVVSKNEHDKKSTVTDDGADGADGAGCEKTKNKEALAAQDNSQ
jgi:hypothetical protein